jgi:hypothetical protein
MKTLRDFLSEAYDPDLKGATVRKEREKRSTEERRKPGVKPRMKAVGGGKSEPVTYKPQGSMPKRSTTKSQREEQPTQERGSARQAQLDAAKEERKKAARARIAARKAGGEVKKTTTSSASAEKKATELLKTKKPEVKKAESKPRRQWSHADGGGMTRKERDAARNKETGQSRKDVKSQLRADFEKKHGRKPNKKEAIQLTAKAHAAAKALK